MVRISVTGGGREHGWVGACESLRISHPLYTQTSPCICLLVMEYGTHLRHPEAEGLAFGEKLLTALSLVS